MTNPIKQESAEQMGTGSLALWLAIGWLWVAAPLAWGVWQTILKAAPLIKSVH